MVNDHFSRDQHEAIIHHLVHIHQIGSVTEYVEQFSLLVDQLAAYDSTPTPLYYTMRLVDGLRDGIKTMVMIHRLSTFNTACALALVEEEAVDSGRRRIVAVWNLHPTGWFHSLVFRCCFPQSWISLCVFLWLKIARALKAARASSVDEKMHSLKQYRHA
jgi:hypothetical protein